LATPRLTLLNGFRLQAGDRIVRLPISTQRVLAFLALHDGDLLRSYVANVLWPDTSEERAAANLRSALWRLRTYQLHVTESNSRMLWLAPAVVIDVREMERLALRVLDPSLIETFEAGLLTRAGELLPGFDDEWLLAERERLRQLRLQALDALCERLMAVGSYSKAIVAGLAAVAAEPLRESAQSLLIRAYLAEGNRAEAIRQFERYCKILCGELNLEPSPELRGTLGIPMNTKIPHLPVAKTPAKSKRWSRRGALMAMVAALGGFTSMQTVNDLATLSFS
jgi:DNA-binding SARP family transcriptional activator